MLETCSVRVTPSAFLAKLASAHCNPDGLLVVPPGDIARFLHPLLVCALWSMGKRTERTADRLREQGYVGRTASIKMRFADFRTIIRARTLPDTTDVAREVSAAARRLFEALKLYCTPCG